MKTLVSVQSDRQQMFKVISLNKLLNSKVKDIEGYITKEFGEPTFKICRLVLDDKDETVLFVGGEHDCAYVEVIGDSVAGLEPEQLEALVEEQNAEPNKPMNLYVIHDWENGLWWHNEDGWTKLEGATVFSEVESKTLDLPIGGHWTKLPLDLFRFLK